MVVDNVPDQLPAGAVLKTLVLDTPVFSDAKGRVEFACRREDPERSGSAWEVKRRQPWRASAPPLRFKVSPSRTHNGSSIRLYGSVPGTEAVTDVELQAQSGKKWVPFKTVSLRRGRFSARYRFERTFATARTASAR